MEQLFLDLDLGFTKGISVQEVGKSQPLDFSGIMA